MQTTPIYRPSGVRFQKIHALRVLATVGFAIFLLGPSATTVRAEDWGGSHNLLIQAPLSEKWFLLSRSNVATRDQFDDWFLGYTGISLGYRFTDQWSLRIGYRSAWLRPGDDWRRENRPMLEGYYAQNWRGFRFTNRARFEFRQFSYQKNDIRFRNEIVVEAPWRFTPLQLRPYLEEEIFYGFRDGNIEANWLGAGLSWFPVSQVKMKVGYRWVRQRTPGGWINRNVLVTGVNFFF